MWRGGQLRCGDLHAKALSRRDPGNDPNGPPNKHDQIAATTMAWKDFRGRPHVGNPNGLPA
ncbi:hypothetical protein DESC_740034 [Desulfosarcina cetonica]|nr:hypothetical protein DESC_740034 [Desulfosarcina cetonica]